MKKEIHILQYAVFYLLVLAATVLGSVFGSKAVTVMAENTPKPDRRCILIDAGHGGEDGGATSCTGVQESNINLEISLRLEDLLHLLGYQTAMIRRTDCSVYTQGQTIAAKKVSDLKNRVKTVNSTENAILISIHQNQFTDSRYFGAQVFYTPNEESKRLAEMLQDSFVSSLNPGSRRQCKAAKGVYLMEHIDCPGVLVECGFLSNHEEESRLRSADYQKKSAASLPPG